jgi:S1-C subfamily serine protease
VMPLRQSLTLVSRLWASGVTRRIVVLLVCVSVALSAHAVPIGTVPSGAASRTAEEQKTIDLYKRANGAVVFITTRSYVVDPFAFFDEVKPQEGTGTGTIVDVDRGIVITNLHVIESALQSHGTVEIMLSTGRVSKARLVGFDPESDIAVLKISDIPKGIEGIPYGDSSILEVGQRVLAIGNPFGLYRSLTAGIISSLDRSMKTPRGAVLKDLIQTDAAINPGNSGGPLLDADGRLIGINTAILSQSGDSAGVGFAVPINSIKRILPELIATGKIRRPRMGWQLVDTDQGPMVLRTIRGGVADVGGIRPIEQLVSSDGQVRGYRRDIDGGDLIYRVNGERVRTRDDVEDAIRKIGRSEPVKLTLRTGGMYGKEREITIVPAWE